MVQLPLAVTLLKVVLGSRYLHIVTSEREPLPPMCIASPDQTLQEMIKALILSVIVATTVADDKCDYYGQKYEDGETWFDDKLKMRCTVNEKGPRINAVACLTPTKNEPVLSGESSVVDFISLAALKRWAEHYVISAAISSTAE
ncbi:unnamed protein product [Heligmosomoides polygyrus]|uniref:Secreted protein n=1 Tax=Heligmosomoides polygyrus TaxID=6339 RepID=A0A183G3G3_HELPZ|nr:unnamed protein product [Heligmosomoides polygyrus]